VFKSRDRYCVISANRRP